ncbi:MAG: hypothetical protein H0U76_13815 [Ktedonobacteraceae bacterium]|nr:hypothetical protein [Ktedonobacteraceae bacterium]
MLMICSPAGFVNFFKELGEPAPERVLPPRRPLVVARIRSVSLTLMDIGLHLWCPASLPASLA